MAFVTLDDAIDHVANTSSLYDLDHIFRPQFWCVADMAGRIALDRICMLSELDNALAGYAPVALDKIAGSPSKPLDITLRPHQLAQLQNLYSIDFAIHDALSNGSLSTGPMRSATHHKFPLQPRRWFCVQGDHRLHKPKFACFRPTVVQAKLSARCHAKLKNRKA